ncbi:hypothetical protein ACVWYH_001907 [Bradyrhizobium sp. GM24.11]
MTIALLPGRPKYCHATVSDSHLRKNAINEMIQGSISRFRGSPPPTQHPNQQLLIRTSTDVIRRY